MNQDFSFRMMQGKGGKSGLQIHEQCLFDTSGKPTAYYRDVYHIQGD